MVKWSKDQQTRTSDIGRTEESRTQFQLYRMFQQQQDESLHISYVPPAPAPAAAPAPAPADEVRDTLACPVRCPGGGGPPAVVGVVGCSCGESRLPFPPPPAPGGSEPTAAALLVARVRNQQSMGSGLPFMMTGPRYSKLNESSWLIAWQRSLQGRKGNHKLQLAKKICYHLKTNGFLNTSVKSYLRHSFKICFPFNLERRSRKYMSEKLF